MLFINNSKLIHHVRRSVFLKDIKLYNMILPPFMLFALVPLFWLISLVGNFIIDSAVLLIISLVIYKSFSGKLYKKAILKVWLLGFAADFVGVLYLIIVSVCSSIWNMFGGGYYEGNDLGRQILSGIDSAMNHSHFDSVWGVLFIVSGILVSAATIFVFDYFISFRNVGFSKKQRLLSALSFAFFTAPYAFLLPKELFY